MEDIRKQIKKQASNLNAIENLESLVKGGFIKPIEKYGSLSNQDEFKIGGNIQSGSNDLESPNGKMWALIQVKIKQFDEDLRQEAQKIIDEYWGGK